MQTLAAKRHARLVLAILPVVIVATPLDEKTLKMNCFTKKVCIGFSSPGMKMILCIMLCR